MLYRVLVYCWLLVFTMASANALPEASLRPTPRDYLPAVELAVVANRLERAPLVERALTAAIEASGSDPEGVAFVAKALGDLGDLERARQVLKDALQRYPAHPSLLEAASKLER